MEHEDVLQQLRLGAHAHVQFKWDHFSRPHCLDLLNVLFCFAEHEARKAKKKRAEKESEMEKN